MKKFIKKLVKFGLYSIGGLFLLGMVAAACSDEEVEKEPVKVEKQKTEVKKEVVKKDHKEDVKKFEEQLLAVDRNYDVKWNAVTEAMKSNDRYKTYEASTLAHKEAKRIWQAYNDIDVPKGLDKEVEKNLKDAKQELQLAYYMKKEAIEAMQEFLDSNKPSKLQKFKDDSASSSSYMYSATAKLLKAKTLVGLPLENN